MRRTGGEGVDVVLNSLAGEAIAKSLAVLAPVRPLPRDRQARHLREQPDRAAAVPQQPVVLRDRPRPLVPSSPDFVRRCSEEPMQRSSARARCGRCRTACSRSTTSSSAFRYMAQAKHIGKVVHLDARARRSRSRRRTAKAVRAARRRHLPDHRRAGRLRPRVARWMVEHGARHLVLWVARAVDPRPTPRSTLMTCSGRRSA